MLRTTHDPANEPQTAVVVDGSIQNGLTKTREQTALEQNIDRNITTRKIGNSIDPKHVLYGDKEREIQIAKKPQTEKIYYRTQTSKNKIKNCVILKNDFTPIVVDLELNPERIFDQIGLQTDVIDKNQFVNDFLEKRKKSKEGKMDRRSKILLFGITINDSGHKGFGKLLNVEKELEESKDDKSFFGFTKVESLVEFLNPISLSEKYVYEIGRNNHLESLSIFDCVFVANQIKSSRIFNQRLFAPNLFDETATGKQIPEIKISSRIQYLEPKMKRVLGGRMLRDSELVVRENRFSHYIYKIVSNIQS